MDMKVDLTTRPAMRRGLAKRIGAIRRGRPTMSPIQRRRWDNFQRNRRGVWSLWLFLVLFVVSLLAETIANDQPLVVHYKGEVLFPIFKHYPESKFGGFLALTDYRDPVIQEEIKANGWMIWPLVRYSYRTVRNDGGPFPAKPTWLKKDMPDCQATDIAAEVRLPLDCSLGNWNWLGSDDQGRDVVARTIYGFRISVLFGLVLTICSTLIGVSAGAIQGYFGGWVDLIFQRILEIWSSTPHLYVLIIIASVLVPGFWTLLGVLLLFHWVSLVGVVRAEFLRGRNFEYITAARALGLSNFSIMFKHLLPNAMVATLTFLPFMLSGSITSLTALDYLGLGMPPGSPSLGELLFQGKQNPQAPWLGLTAFSVMAIMLSLLIFVGEAVRDALDPRKTYR